MRITPAIVTSGGSHSLAGPLRMGYMKVEKKRRRMCAWVQSPLGSSSGSARPVSRRFAVEPITLQSNHESGQKDDHEGEC
jgi:hypothetical protein